MLLLSFYVCAAAALCIWEPTIDWCRISCDWTVVVPELDWLHVFLAEPLELGSHWLVAVPESLTVLLSRFWLRDLNPGRNNDQTCYFKMSGHPQYHVQMKMTALDNDGTAVLAKPYLSISRVRSSCGLQNDRYVVRNVRTKLGSTKTWNSLDNEEKTENISLQIEHISNVFLQEDLFQHLTSIHVVGEPFYELDHCASFNDGDACFALHFVLKNYILLRVLHSKAVNFRGGQS